MDRKETRRSLIERLSKKVAMIGGATAIGAAGVLATTDDAEAGCAWYYTGYRECRPKFFCTGGVAWYYQQAYYCSDRYPGPLSYRFVMGGCGCNPWE